MSKIISFILLLLLSASTAQAQRNNSSEALYNEAERAYDIGDIDKAEQQLLKHIRSLKGDYKQAAYRLLALCVLERGDINKAREYVASLLKANPYYTSTVQDPLRLRDLIEESKQQETGITTASRQVETIEEAPVPVTVITEDMIHHSGATTLQELLCLYVPGMSLAEGMESNIAMHGISGLTQECILFLQDGHRLNGGSSNAEAPDYRNSLDKIQQIEVLRGPASSLYGNVALTAVVNIITHKGAILNGGRISATIGTQDTYGGSFVVGGGNNVVDITGWGSINSTKGFKHVIDNTVCGGTTTLYTHGYNRRPAYDIGIKARWGDFIMTINSQRSKQVPYINILQLAADQKVEYGYDENLNIKITSYSPTEADYRAIQNYNYDKYDAVNSNGPGTTRTNHHINIDYSHSFGKTDFKASGYISLEHTDFFNAMGDTINKNLMSAVALMVFNQTGSSNSIAGPLGIMLASFNSKGMYFNVNWENISFGGQAQLNTTYNLLGHGSAIFGLQYEHFAMTDGEFNMGSGFSPTDLITKGNVFREGMEDIFSAYTQIKHYFSPSFILNAGLRYDHKIRLDNDRINYVSPRVSLIYRITGHLSARASFNTSFVDAPFLYRALTLNILGGNDLKPEKMMSIQTGLTYHNPDLHLTAEVSGYYNRITDFMTQVLGSTSGYGFQSSGRMRQICAEAAAQYVNNHLIVNANATWQRIIKMSQECNVVNGNRLGIPQLMGNIAVSWAPYVGKGTGFIHGGKLWLSATASAQTTTYYQNVDFMLSTFSALQSAYSTATSTSSSDDSSANNASVSSTITTKEICTVKPQVVLGVSARYEWKYLDLSISLKNIANNQYNVGSTMSGGVPHAGRQLIGKLTFKF